MLAKSRILVTRFPFSSRLGGEELHTLRLMKSLGERGFEVRFLGSDPVLFEAFESGDFGHVKTTKFWLGPCPVSKKNLLIFLILSPLLFGLGIGLLFWARFVWKIESIYMHSLGEKILLTLPAKLLGFKTLWLEHARLGKWLTGSPLFPIYKLLSRAAIIVVTSHAMGDVFDELGLPAKVISCGLILDKKEPLRSEIAAFMDKGFCVIHVARLTVDKGVDMMVRTVDIQPHTRLVMLGDGPLKEDILSFEDSGRVLQMDSLPRGQLMSLYEKADVLVLASTEMDPFGMVVAEAMAMGTAVIATKKCGITKDLTHGENALVVDANLKEIGTAIQTLKNDEKLKKKLQKNGQKFALKTYDFEHMVDAFEQLIG